MDDRLLNLAKKMGFIVYNTCTKETGVLVELSVSHTLCRSPVYKQGVWDSQMCPVYHGVLISGVLIR